MRFATLVIFALALVATCLGAAIDIGTGLDLTPGDTTFWSKDIVIGDQPIQVGLGWQRDGTIAAGAKVYAKVKGQQVPISAALNSNINNLKQIQYEIGTKVADTVSGVVMGNLNGDFWYQINTKVPVKATGVKSIGASLQGTSLQQTTLTGGVALEHEVVQAVVQLDGLKPSSVNLQVGANTVMK